MRTKSSGETPIPIEYWNKTYMYMAKKKKKEPAVQVVPEKVDETVVEIKKFLNKIKGRARITHDELNEMLSFYNKYHKQTYKVNDIRPDTLHKALIDIVDKWN
jgi:hypothetical protein